MITNAAITHGHRHSRASNDGGGASKHVAVDTQISGLVGEQASNALQPFALFNRFTVTPSPSYPG